jgi:hypothetical protein
MMPEPPFRRSRTRDRASERCFTRLEHFPEKWAPVFRIKCDKIKT